MANCNSVASAASKYWNQFDDVLAVLGNAHPTLSAADKALRTADKMITKWNKIFGGNSGAKVGPRKLEFGKTLKGRLVLERVFVTERSTKAQATVRLKKTGGKAKKATVRVCTFDKRGRHKEVKTIEVKRSHDKGKTWTVTVPSGKLVSVLLRKPAGTNTLRYEVKITE